MDTRGVCTSDGLGCVGMEERYYPTVFAPLFDVLNIYCNKIVRTIICTFTDSLLDNSLKTNARSLVCSTNLIVLYNCFCCALFAPSMTFVNLQTAFDKWGLECLMR